MTLEEELEHVWSRDIVRAKRLQATWSGRVDYGLSDYDVAIGKASWYFDQFPEYVARCVETRRLVKLRMVEALTSSLPYILQFAKRIAKEEENEDGKA